jgi:hypothetical protein
VKSAERSAERSAESSGAEEYRGRSTPCLDYRGVQRSAESPPLWVRDYSEYRAVQRSTVSSPHALP